MDKRSNMAEIFKLKAPLISRRLGKSLGVDLVTKKSCPLDCIYCEAGRTTLLTNRRQRFFDLDEVKSALKNYLDTAPELDSITFSGRGEPTLSCDILPVVDFLKKNYPGYKLTLLTNGVFLGEKDIIEAGAMLDLIIPSFDGSNEAEFLKIDRPAPGVTFAAYRQNLVSFCQKYGRKVKLEIFLVPGINDTPESVMRFQALASECAPLAVQINTLDRPGTENDIVIPTTKSAELFALRIAQVCDVELLIRHQVLTIKQKTEVRK